MLNFFKNRGHLPKVKIVAVAKDEAAYLPYWVHHHISMGFDAIEILVNRTTDNSEAILDKISLIYPQVTHKNIDWIDLCSPGVRGKIQEINYALALQKERERKEFDYLIFLDIDEFWMPSSLSETIGERIRKLRYPNSISFQWINELAGEKDFSPLSQKISGVRHPLSKTVFKITADVESVLLHVPQIRGSKKMVFADGTRFMSIEGKPEQIHSKASKDRDIMVIHRMFRSSLEYVSLLNRGRPSTTDFSLKTNRSGFNVSMGQSTTYELNFERHEELLNDYKSFIFKSGLKEDIKTAQEFVVDRFNKSLEAVRTAPDKYAREVVRILRNTSPKVINVLDERFGGDEYIEKIDRPLVLAEIATEYQHINLNIAEKYIDRALFLHPDGPKLKQLKERFSKLKADSDSKEQSR